MRAIVIDDEPLARAELRRLLKAFPFVDIVGEAANGTEAANQIDKHNPDLVFLDINMPGENAFDLLARLNRMPKVIFTTAYDQYAVKAFEVSALDYLLKPIETPRLAAAISKASAQLQARHESGSLLERVFVRDGDRCWFIPLDEVRLLESEGNFVRLYWGEITPLLSRSLVSIETRLDSSRFFRVNRKQVINLDFIASIDMGSGGRLHLLLRDGPEIEVSRRQARIFRQRAG